jgi:transposase-like protein
VVQQFTPLLAAAARPCGHAVGDRWSGDETDVKVAGRWRYVYRAIDQFGQIIDVVVFPQWDATAAPRFLERALGTTKVAPVEVVTDRAATYPMVLQELLPPAWRRTEQSANNRAEADHGRLKARLQLSAAQAGPRQRDHGWARLRPSTSGMDTTNWRLPSR